MIAMITPMGSPVLATDAVKHGSKLWQDTKVLTFRGTSRPSPSLEKNIGPHQLLVHALAIHQEVVMSCIGTGWNRTSKSLEMIS
jgi:hypothetical protein